MTAVIACGDSSAPTAVPSPSDVGAPTSTDELAPTDEPAPTADPAPTHEPAQTAEPTPEGGSADPAPTDASGSAAACAGSDDNRAFYANAAGAVDWPVYCPVLPAGWFVGTVQAKMPVNGAMDALSGAPTPRL